MADPTACAIRPSTAAETHAECSEKLVLSLTTMWITVYRGHERRLAIQNRTHSPCYCTVILPFIVG